MNKPYITKVHIIFEVLSIVICAASVIFGIFFAMRGGDPVPTHFSITGEVQSYGSPWSILTSPGIILITDIVLSLIIHFLPADKWNISFKINPGRELIVFTDISLMIAVMELTMAIWSLAVTMLWTSGLSSGIFISAIIMSVALIAEVAFFYILAKRHNTL